MRVLGIESTCDETGCAIVEDGHTIVANVVASQHDIHASYGGVFPELASRRHVDVIFPILQECLRQADLPLSAIDLISVAHGPGLLGALLVGVTTAKTLAFCEQKPLIGVNHVEAHLYAALMSQPTPPQFPCIGVVLSGAHTHIYYMKAIGDYELLAQTIDDAIGEAFDKVAKILGLPYPGGPEIERIAKKGSPKHHPFKAGFVKRNPQNFSFSGIKTSVLYTVKGQNSTYQSDLTISEEEKQHIAASFQECVFRDVIKKTLNAAEEKGCNTILFGGGVTNNRRLRELFAEKAPNKTLYWPLAGLSLDNAAMIAGLGFHKYRDTPRDERKELQPITRIPLG